MMTIDIRCDACDQDLADAGGMPTYRLELSPARVANSGMVMYSVHVEPSIKRTHHFCGLLCLDTWRARDNYVATFMSNWYDDWKVDPEGGKGKPNDRGEINAWYSPPKEKTEEARARAMAEARVAYPGRKQR